jgi:hypothetical protein
MNKFAISLMAVALIASPLLAGPLNKEKVAGDAAWVAHVDIDALLKSDLGKFVLDKAGEKDKFIEGLVKLQEAFGLDPLRDIRGLTLYGEKIGDKDEQGVVIADATLDADKVLPLLRENVTYKAIEHGDRVLHQWTDQKEGKPAKTQTGCFYDAKTIVIGSTVDLVKKAVAVLDGEVANLVKTGALSNLPKPAAGAFLIAAAEGIDLSSEEEHPKAAIFRSVTGGVLQAGELDGVLFASLALTAKNAEDAANIRQMAQGFVALFKVGMQEKLPEDLQNLGEKITVGGSEATAQLDVTLPTESAIKLVKHLKGMKEAVKRRTARIRERL